MAILGGLVYPPLVYFGLSALPPGRIVLFGLVLIGLRLAAARRSGQARIGIFILAAVAVALTVLVEFDARAAVLAYPVAISLTVAATFGASLIWPPTVIERIARLSEPNLSSQGTAYARQITWVWTIFLIANAAVSAASALWGTLEQWTLWNGLLSYLLMGLLFVGEYLVRQRVRRVSTPPV